MAASDHLSPGQFYHGTPGTYEFKPGDVLTPGAQSTRIGGYAKHVYYTSDLPSARTYAGYGPPVGANGRPDLDADALPGHVYAVQPETPSGRNVGKHAVDPYSGALGNLNAYRTKGRLRVLHEVDKHTGEPIAGQAGP